MQFSWGPYRAGTLVRKCSWYLEPLCTRIEHFWGGGGFGWRSIHWGWCWQDCTGEIGGDILAGGVGEANESFNGEIVNTWDTLQLEIDGLGKEAVDPDFEIVPIATSFDEEVLFWDTETCSMLLLLFSLLQARFLSKVSIFFFKIFTSLINFSF